MGFGNLISADILAEKRLKKVHHDDKKEKKEKSSVLHAEPSKSPSTVKTKAPATVRKHCSKASSCPSSLVFGLSQNNPFSWLISWDLKSLTSIAFSFPQSAKSRPAPPVPQCPPSKHFTSSPNINIQILHTELHIHIHDKLVERMCFKIKAFSLK